MFVDPRSSRKFRVLSLLKHLGLWSLRKRLTILSFMSAVMENNNEQTDQITWLLTRKPKDCSENEHQIDSDHSQRYEDFKMLELILCRSSHRFNKV